MLEIAETFKFNRHKIRTVAIDGQHWFIARDICDAIGRKSVQAATTALKSDEKKTVFIKDFWQGKPKTDSDFSRWFRKTFIQKYWRDYEEGFSRAAGRGNSSDF